MHTAFAITMSTRPKVKAPCVVFILLEPSFHYNPKVVALKKPKLCLPSQHKTKKPMGYIESFGLNAKPTLTSIAKSTKEAG